MIAGQLFTDKKFTFKMVTILEQFRLRENRKFYYKDSDGPRTITEKTYILREKNIMGDNRKTRTNYGATGGKMVKLTVHNSSRLVMTFENHCRQPI